MNTPDLYYYLALACVHWALFQCILNFKAQPRHWRSWQGVCLGACVLAMLYPMVKVYEVIPALWWPGAQEQFLYWVRGSAAPVIVSLGLSASFRFRLARRGVATPV
jgi:hypothetical protein